MLLSAAAEDAEAFSAAADDDAAALLCALSAADDEPQPLSIPQSSAAAVSHAICLRIFFSSEFRL